jgi:hypothetical protein
MMAKNAFTILICVDDDDLCYTNMRAIIYVSSCRFGGPTYEGNKGGQIMRCELMIVLRRS